jgi:hypothetical protein
MGQEWGKSGVASPSSPFMAIKTREGATGDASVIWTDWIESAESCLEGAVGHDLSQDSKPLGFYPRFARFPSSLSLGSR